MGRGNPNKVFDLNLTSESRDHRDFPQTISLNESVNSKLRGKSWDAISPKTLPGRRSRLFKLYEWLFAVVPGKSEKKCSHHLEIHLGFNVLEKKKREGLERESLFTKRC
ncbi:uncharacterized protein LOC144617055 isoform X1 [Panthera onca]